MIKKDINQNDILNSELFNILDYNYVFNDKPIKRTKTKPTLENSSIKLGTLKQKIEKIQNCDLKKNASKIVFGDGDILSQIMIVGEGPGQKEDEIGQPFVGDAGNLLNKMLKAIKIEREKIYVTNVVNYRPPNNRKPEQSEINRYSEYLKEHISIIDPKILILMGSTAMEAILGSKERISQERGQWKEVIIGEKKLQNYYYISSCISFEKTGSKKIFLGGFKNYL